MSKKFSQLPAGVAPFDVDSLVAIAVDDGLGVLTSSKLTLQQLRIALSIADSAIQSKVLSDASSGAAIDFDGTSKNDVYLTTDDAGFLTAYIGVWDDDISNGGFEIGGGNCDYYHLITSSGTMYKIYQDGFTASVDWFVNGDNSAGAVTTNDNDKRPTAISIRNINMQTAKTNAVGAAGYNIILDTDDLVHSNGYNNKILDLGSVGVNQTITISNGAHVKLTPTANITINVNTHSTNNAIRWTLEVDNSGGHTITQGTGFVNQAGGTWAAFGTGLEVIELKTLISGSSLVEQQFNTVS